MTLKQALNLISDLKSGGFFVANHSQYKSFHYVVYDDGVNYVGINPAIREIYTNLLN